MRLPASPNKVNTVIFDLDGVIADSGDVFLEALGEVLKRPEPFSNEEIDDLRGSSTREIIKKIGIKKWQLPRMIIEGRQLVAEKMDQVEVFEGITQALSDLIKEGYSLYLLSTNDENAITDLLDRNGLNHTFSDIYAGTSLFGKANRLNALIKRHGLVKNQCVYVGDETRDIEAAKRVGIRCLAVGWGYSSPTSLESYKPDILISKPEELVSAIASL